MYNPIVTLLAIAAVTGTVFAADTPTTRNYWAKINGTWVYMPELLWKNMESSQPTGSAKIVLPLSQVPPVNLTVLPRWVKRAKVAARKCSYWGWTDEDADPSTCPPIDEEREEALRKWLSIPPDE